MAKQTISSFHSRSYKIAVISQQLCARANFECAVFYYILLLNHIFQRVPSPQSTTPSSKFSTMEMEKVVAEKLDGCSSKCSSTLVQCWRNWTIVKFGRFVTELRTIGPLSILPQFRHHFTIGCYPLSPSPPGRGSIPPDPCSHLVIPVFANLQSLSCKT